MNTKNPTLLSLLVPRDNLKCTLVAFYHPLSNYYPNPNPTKKIEAWPEKKYVYQKPRKYPLAIWPSLNWLLIESMKKAKPFDTIQKEKEKEKVKKEKTPNCNKARNRESRIYKWVDAPPLQQILTRREAMTPTTAKTSVVTTKPIALVTNNETQKLN